MSSEHPLHPATVHFPIAFLALSNALDLLYGSTVLLRLPILASNATIATALPDIARAAHYLLALGTVTMIPAILSGGAQAYKMVQVQGIYEADGKTVKPKVKAVGAHAVLNDLVLFAAGYSLYSRMDTPGFAPGPVNVAIAGLGFAVLMFAANIGGTLTYNYGMGLALGSSSKGKKQ